MCVSRNISSLSSRKDGVAWWRVQTDPYSLPTGTLSVCYWEARGTVFFLGSLRDSLFDFGFLAVPLCLAFFGFPCFIFDLQSSPRETSGVPPSMPSPLILSLARSVLRNSQVLRLPACLLSWSLGSNPAPHTHGSVFYHWATPLDRYFFQQIDLILQRAFQLDRHFLPCSV